MERERPPIVLPEEKEVTQPQTGRVVLLPDEGITEVRGQPLEDSDYASERQTRYH